ncbi:MAG: ABC transporter ATP-binding protein [Anaerolineae bacterium]|nr:ABC transporter ATP-binding protein [Anaerolineae bacterium]
MEEKFAVEVRNVTKRFAGPTGRPGSEVVAVADVTLRVCEREFFSMLGPSGCGKTTTLRMIAGFENPTAGEIYIHGKPMGLTPPYQRNTNMVFQNYALFPHMTIARNVGFGLEMKKVPKSDIERRVQEVLEMVRLPGFGPRRPNQLSGGQQQRIALARALVNRPEVLLLDEPLGALDLKLRKEMQLELKTLQQDVGITFVYVTHDQEEALTMSDRIAVMHQGKVLQVGTPTEIYERPTCRFVADFIGESNFLAGAVQEQRASLATVLVDGRLSIVAHTDQALNPGDLVTVAVRPEKVRLLPRALGGENNTFDGRVEQVVYIGTATVFKIRLSDQVLLTVREQNVISAAERRAYDWGSGGQVHVTWPYDAGRILLD